MIIRTKAGIIMIPDEIADKVLNDAKERERKGDNKGK